MSVQSEMPPTNHIGSAHANTEDQEAFRRPGRVGHSSPFVTVKQKSTTGGHKGSPPLPAILPDTVTEDENGNHTEMGERCLFLFYEDYFTRVIY